MAEKYTMLADLTASTFDKRIKLFEFVEDANGYQHLHILLDDGTIIHAWEHAQAGEMMLRVCSPDGRSINKPVDQPVKR